MNVAVVGLGRLGAPMAATFAAAGLNVVGVDLNRAIVETLASGREPVVEPGLGEAIKQAGTRLRATMDFDVALDQAEISFIVVPTPSGSDGMFRLDFVLDAVVKIGSFLKRNVGRRQVVVITSTVMPGSTMGPIRDALEASSGLTVGDTVGLCYSPEFIALGTVLANLRNPDMILVGESDAASGDRLLNALSTVVETDVPAARMDPTSAEVAKLAVNTFVTTKISYANMLAEICERLPGADASAVTHAVGLDSRIGPKYLRPGAPFGGPCFPRDNAALAALARSIGTTAEIAEATDAINRRQTDRVIDLIRSHARIDSRIAILGLSYKPGTPVRDESFGVSVAARCIEGGLEVVVWDPLALVGPLPQSIVAARVTDSLEDAVSQADIAVVATPWPELAALPSVIERLRKPQVVVDCWHSLGELPAGSQTLVIELGRGAEGRARSTA